MAGRRDRRGSCTAACAGCAPRRAKLQRFASGRARRGEQCEQRLNESGANRGSWFRENEGLKFRHVAKRDSARGHDEQRTNEPSANRVSAICKIRDLKFSECVVFHVADFMPLARCTLAPCGRGWRTVERSEDGEPGEGFLLRSTRTPHPAPSARPSPTRGEGELSSRPDLTER